MLRFNKDWVTRAKSVVMEPALVLHGAISEQALASDVLSHEVATFFGMLCAAIEPLALGI